MEKIYCSNNLAEEYSSLYRSCETIRIDVIKY